MTVAGMVPVSLVDYPGHVATTLFLAGCNLRCPYCHNPGLVVGPPAGPPLAEDRVLEFLRARRGQLGHVCVTGGEPTQHPGLARLLAACKELGYRVKLDTNGSHPERLGVLLRKGLVDYVAMDVKTSWSRYGELGGDPVPADVLRASVALIQADAPDHEFRTTVVPGLVDHADILAIATGLRGARRYALQQFVVQGPLLDPGWATVVPYPAATLRGWAAEAAAATGVPVEVRNA